MSRIHEKNIIVVLIPIVISIIFIFGIYKMIEFLDDRSSISNLTKYTFTSNEKIVKSFKYNKYHYIITKYFDDTSSWNHLHILLQDNKNYYILKNIIKCDMTDSGNNVYIKDNEIYIHCIGKKGTIDKYLINNLEIKKETLNFNYENTPNISQLHIGIDNVDSKNIYLSSPFKVDYAIKDAPRVKCSLKDKICRYY